jgi:hypothetical protein
MISYQSLINKIIDFYDSHLQVKKVGSDFREQLENFATKDEKYPLVYISPIDAAPSEMGFTTEINLEIYCFDIIQKDRANINVILSDCHLILNDLYNWFLNSDDYSFDIVGVPTMTPLNNDLLDYAAGWLMTVTCSINNYTDCQVPLKEETPPLSCDCISVTYQLEGEDPVTVEVQSSGISNGKKRYNLIIDDKNVIIKWDSDDNLWYVQSLYILDDLYLDSQTECPFGTFIIPESPSGLIFESFVVSECIL